MKLILYSLLALMLISSVTAFSYGGDMSLKFEGKAKDTICTNWFMWSDQNLTITNKWSSNNSRWSSGDMKYSAGHKRLIVEHIKAYSARSSTTSQVCIRAANPGEYRGMLFLDYAQKGNQKIRMGIWLKVVAK